MGRDERRAILELRIPGIDVVLDTELLGVPQKHLFDAAALLWTARRVSAHAAKRIPTEPEWDSEGLRMEYDVVTRSAERLWAYASGANHTRRYDGPLDTSRRRVECPVGSTMPRGRPPRGSVTSPQLVGRRRGP